MQLGGEAKLRRRAEERRRRFGGWKLRHGHYRTDTNCESEKFYGTMERQRERARAKTERIRESITALSSYLLRGEIQVHHLTINHTINRLDMFNDCRSNLRERWRRRDRRGDHRRRSGRNPRRGRLKLWGCNRRRRMVVWSSSTSGKREHILCRVEVFFTDQNHISNALSTRVH